MIDDRRMDRLWLAFNLNRQSSMSNPQSLTTPFLPHPSHFPILTSSGCK
jgi:hypothetical protein